MFSVVLSSKQVTILHGDHDQSTHGNWATGLSNSDIGQRFFGSKTGQYQVIDRTREPVELRDEYIQELASKHGLENVTEVNDLIRSVGIPHGSNVEIAINPDKITISTSQEFANYDDDGNELNTFRVDMSRSIIADYDADGKVIGSYIYNSQFFIYGESPAGFGTHAFASQVHEAQAIGISAIETGAIGNPHDTTANGYYTWARLGYDAVAPLKRGVENEDTTPQAVKDIVNRYQEAMLEQNDKPYSERDWSKADALQPRIQMIMAAEGGAKWWKEIGGNQFSGKFDLTEGSVSMQVLESYLHEKGYLPRIETLSLAHVHVIELPPAFPHSWNTIKKIVKLHGDHDQSDHGNWADGISSGSDSINYETTTNEYGTRVFTEATFNQYFTETANVIESGKVASGLPTFGKERYSEFIQFRADYFDQHIEAGFFGEDIDSREDLRAAVQEKMTEYFKNAAPTIRIPDSVLEKVLEEGFKNQHETGDDGGGDTLRENTEGKYLFNLSDVNPKENPEKYPIYAYADYREIATTGEERVSHFGNLAIVLKPEVYERSTFTVGDSYATAGLTLPTPVNRPDVAAIPGGDYSREYYPGDKWAVDTANSGHYHVVTREPKDIARVSSYVELQIHGGVTKDDIAYITMDGYDDGEHYEEMKERLEATGIPWIEITPDVR